MVKVKCNQCGKVFEESYFEWIIAQFLLFNLGFAKFICPKCHKAENLSIDIRRCNYG